MIDEISNHRAANYTEVSYKEAAYVRSASNKQEERSPWKDMLLDEAGFYGLGASGLSGNDVGRASTSLSHELALNNHSAMFPALSSSAIILHQ